MKLKNKTIRETDCFYDGKGNTHYMSIEYDERSTAIISSNFWTKRARPNLKDFLTSSQLSKFENLKIRGKTERLLSAIRREIELFPNKNYDSLKDTRTVNRFLKQYCSEL